MDNSLSFVNWRIEWLQNKIDYHEPIIQKQGYIINSRKAILKHEIGHIVHNDSKKQEYSEVTIPALVQLACSTTSYGFTKILHIQAPKTLGKTLLRSSFAVASTPLKIGLSFITYNIYCRQQEKEADEFACQNAETKEELEAFSNYFRNLQNKFDDNLMDEPNELTNPVNNKPYGAIRQSIINMASKKANSFENKINNLDSYWAKIAHMMFDPKHSHYSYRINSIQKHINEWDENHSNEQKN